MNIDEESCTNKSPKGMRADMDDAATADEEATHAKAAEGDATIVQEEGKKNVQVPFSNDAKKPAAAAAASESETLQEAKLQMAYPPPLRSGSTKEKTETAGRGKQLPTPAPAAGEPKQKGLKRGLGYRIEAKRKEMEAKPKVSDSGQQGAKITGAEKEAKRPLFAKLFKRRTSDGSSSKTRWAAKEAKRPHLAPGSTQASRRPSSRWASKEAKRPQPPPSGDGGAHATNAQTLRGRNKLAKLRRDTLDNDDPEAEVDLERGRSVSSSLEDTEDVERNDPPAMRAGSGDSACTSRAPQDEGVVPTADEDNREEGTDNARVSSVLQEEENDDASLRHEEAVHSTDERSEAAVVSTTSDSVDDRDEESNIPPRPGLNDDDLVEAQPVAERSQRDMPQAREMDIQQEEVATRTRRRKTVYRTVRFVSFWTLVLLVVVFLLLMLLSDDSCDCPVVAPTNATSNVSAPTEAPSQSIEEYVISRLPAFSRVAASNQRKPQFKALQWLTNDPELMRYPDWRIQQRFALASFYYSAGGASWNSADKWMDHNYHECLWYSDPHWGLTDPPPYQYWMSSPYGQLVNVSLAYEPNVKPLGMVCGAYDICAGVWNPCEEDPTSNITQGVYKHLWLSENNLAGSLPLELFLLSSLKSISLHSNPELGGAALPSYIGQLTSLEAIGYTGTQVGGAIPTEVGLLGNLSDLILISNAMTGTLPSQLGLLKKLKNLLLDTNMIVGTMPRELGDMKNLRWLYLQRNLLTGTIPSVLGLLNLTELQLNANSLTGQIPTEMGQLTNANWVYLHQNSLTGTIPSEWGLLSNGMYWLHLYSNHLSKTIPTELARLTNLWGLRLQSNALSGPIPSQLGLLSNLTSLRLFGNQLSSTIPSELGPLKHMTNFRLQDNQLTGRVPSEFGQATNMILLFLRNNSLSGPIPSELGALSRLKHLWLDQNQLSGSLPTELFELATSVNGSLIDWNVTGNSFLSGTVPDGVCAVETLDFYCSPSRLCGCDWCPCWAPSLNGTTVAYWYSDVGSNGGA